MYMAGVIIPRVGPEGDPAARLVWYMWADEGIKAFAPHMFALAVEASQHDEAARRDMREAYERIFRELIDDLARLRTSDREPPISDELISHGMMGAFQQMLARAALDDEYSWREVTRHTLGLFLLLLTAYRGEQDLGALLAPYEDLLTEVAELPPPVPPELERPERRRAATGWPALRLTRTGPSAGLTDRPEWTYRPDMPVKSPVAQLARAAPARV